MAIEIRPFDAPIGVEITGLDFNDPLAADTVAALNQAFLDHHVLCIRDQEISMDRFLSFQKYAVEPPGFGEIGGGGVHDRTVVPDQGVVRMPIMVVLIFWLDAERFQLV